MKPNTVNPKLRAAIKLRRLVDAITENWRHMKGVSMDVQGVLEEASAYMNTYGTKEAKQSYNQEIAEANQHVAIIQNLLTEASESLKNGGSFDLKVSRDTFIRSFGVVEKKFSLFGKMPINSFTKDNFKDWESIWKVIQSNFSIIKGLSEAAYLRAQMIEEFSKKELDDLTKTIVKYIPNSFSLMEADKYEGEYLEAMEMIKLESSEKQNLWDRLLNILAGAMPFEQTPAERVMMQRWLEGERGEL